LASIIDPAILDLIGSDLGTLRGQLPRGRSPEGTEHLYVLQFGTLVKVGRTNNPANRFVFHRNSHLRTMGGHLTRAWLSAAHASAKKNETTLRAFCRSLGGKRWFSKHEIFTDLDSCVESVIDRAAELALADPTLTIERRPAPESQLAPSRSINYARGHLAGIREVLGWLESAASTRSDLDLATVQRISQSVDGMAQSSSDRIAAHGSLANPVKAIEGATA
jgi:hypothetical protein